MRIKHALTAMALAALAPTAALAQGPGDECSAPIIVSGASIIPYNPADYTASSEPFADPGTCLQPGVAYWRNDVWVCWTADCTGLVSLGLCGGPVPGGSHLAIWPGGCMCPGDIPPLCCADEGCVDQGYAAVTCEVVCGQQYLIRASSDVAFQAQMNLTIDCVGRPCPPGRENPHGPGSVCGTCCSIPPEFTGFTRPTVISTDYQYDLVTFQNGDPNKIVVHVYEVDSPPAAPTVWNAVPRVDDPQWTLSKLGTVFGVTSDDQGNIYVAHSRVFLSNEVGSLGGTTGGIHMLATSNGAPSLLVNLPNSADGPGLGNLTWSCDRRNLYVTNFEDGRIYRVDPAAPMATRIRSAWDYSTDALDTSGNAEVGDAAGAVPLGERVWAVADGGDRLFFSVWSEDSSGSAGPNTIWSVGLDASGDPIPGTKTLEITLTDFTMRHSPVADLAFDGNCCLYAAQRTMGGFSTGAHNSDLLHFCWEEDAAGVGSWVAGNTFLVGDANIVGLEHSSAGGVGVDLGANGLVWATGDALAFGSAKFGGQVGYGVVGLPQSGGGSPQSVVIDNDNDTIGGDKNLQGSCEVMCSLEECTVDVEDVQCVLGPDGFPTGEYSVTMNIHNGSGQTVNLLLFPSLGTFQHLDPPLQNGQDLAIKVFVTGNAGEQFSIPIGLYDGFNDCCGVKAMFELPECDCVLFTEVEVECQPDGDPTTLEYTVNFNLHNIAVSPSFVATWFFLIPPPGSDYSFSPTVVNVFPLPPGGQTSVGPLTLTFTTPPVIGPDGNWTLIVPVSLHNVNLGICCDSVLVLKGPLPCEPSCSPDLNGDGVVDGNDLGTLLGAWGAGGAGTCADLNGDGVVDGNDLGTLLGAWS